MSQLDAYLFFDGNCAEAMRFYERTLGGKLEALLTHADSPAAQQAPPGMADRIMHARLVFEGGVLMASDDQPGQRVEKKGFALSLTFPDAEAAKQKFDALVTGGKVTMPFSQTFWADGFGMLVDRFGTPWMVGGGAPKS
jgi:PhnB protein